MPIRGKTNPGGKSSKREPINQSDGQTAHSHVPVLKPSMSCFPGWLSTGWREPSKVLGAEFPPEPGSSWTDWRKDWESQQGGQDLLTRLGAATLHLSHINPCSQLPPIPPGEKGEQGEKKELCCFGLGWVYSPAGRSHPSSNQVKSQCTEGAGRSPASLARTALQDKHTSE